MGVVANLALVSDKALLKKRVYRRRTAPDFDAFNHRLAERMYELHVSLELDQDNVARKANLHRTHVSQIEKPKPTYESTFPKLAKVLELSVSDLLDFPLT